MYSIPRAIIGRGLCLMIVAAVAAGCVGTEPKTLDGPLAVVHEVKPDVAAQPAEVKTAEAPSRPTIEPDIGLTPLERIALAEKTIKAEKERRSTLERQLESTRKRYAEAKMKLDEQTELNDKLRRQLVDMDTIIDEVQKETKQVQALRAGNINLQQQLKTAHADLTTRKKELLDLTLKLEDIYNVLIKEAEARKKAQDAARYVGDNR